MVMTDSPIAIFDILLEFTFQFVAIAIAIDISIPKSLITAATFGTTIICT